MISVFIFRRSKGLESDLELRVIPRYTSANRNIRLLGKIATGSFAIVWKGKYNRELVAVKLIRAEKKKDKGNVKMAQMICDEAITMQKMNHPRIVKFIFFESQSMGIVLEYMSLGSLKVYIQKSEGSITWQERHQLMKDICEGMEFLHSSAYPDGSAKPVLFHQDLKSANVLLSMEDGSLRGKISDFGLSCTCDIS